MSIAEQMKHFYTNDQRSELIAECEERASTSELETDLMATTYTFADGSVIRDCGSAGIYAYAMG